jgi:exosortase C (VPDSG-CTERM-specific)
VKKLLDFIWCRGETHALPLGRRRVIGFVVFLALLILAFIKPLVALTFYVAGASLHSHILLVPFVSAYLLYINWRRLPRHYDSSFGWAILPLVAGVGALVAHSWLRATGQLLSQNDSLALIAFAFVCLLVAGGFAFLGKQWMRAAAFPVVFLFFLVPLPDRAVDALETASKYASAEAASLFFAISGTPVLRDGLVFQLPGITIEVAQECSGIRSSWVLFITSLLASHLFLTSPWRRAILVAFIIPLGILRNGFRILVLGLLCVHFGPHMIHSIIHHRGGPLFFALSLVPLFILIWWLRRGEGSARVPLAGPGVPPRQM